MNMQWLIGFTLLIIIFSVTAAFGLADIDLLNPVTSQAEAERISAETRHLDAMNQFEEQLTAAKTEQQIADIRHEMGLEETRYQAELARIAADQAHYERMLSIKANAYQGLMTVLLIVGGATGTSVIIIGSKLALARIPANAAAPSPATAKQSYRQTARRRSPNGYEQARINARQREILDRYITLRRVRLACNTPNMTPQEYKNLPLAGD